MFEDTFIAFVFVTIYGFMAVYVFENIEVIIDFVKGNKEDKVHEMPSESAGPAEGDMENEDEYQGICADTILEIMESAPFSKWPNLSKEFKKLKNNIKKINSYKDKQKWLIENNHQCKALPDMDTVLSDAEQYICQLMMKALNLMVALSPESAADAEIVSRALKLCNRKSEECLMNVADFMYALAEYYNQGLEDSIIPGTEKLELYKKALMETIMHDQENPET